jgi:hypothetical protein
VEDNGPEWSPGSKTTMLRRNGPVTEQGRGAMGW